MTDPGAHHPAKLRRSRTRIAFLFLSVIVVGVPLVIGTIYVVKWHFRITHAKDAGNQIVFGLNQFESKNGAYPSSLEALVPKYLNSVPPPAEGAKWSYWTNGGAFELTFGDDGALPEYYFDSRRPAWREDRS